MFDQTFVEKEKTAKPSTILFSVLLQVAALSVLIILPLLYTQVLPTAQLKSLLMAPAPPRPALPKQVIERAARSTVPVRALRASFLTAPVRIPNRIVKTETVGAAPDLGISGAGIGTDDALPSPVLLGATGTSVPLPPEPPAAKNPTKPVRLGGQVAEANLIRRVVPEYPALAKAARVSGTVEFSAVISKEGRVENLQLVSGHPLLVGAARRAVLEWVYRPTMLNGQPVEVLTTISVKFMLGQ